MDKANKYADPSETNSGYSQSSNDNDKKYQHESDESGDENSNKYFSILNQKVISKQYAYLSDSKDDNIQSRISSGVSKEKQNQSDDSNDSLNDKDKKSKLYELQTSSHSVKKDNNYKYDFTLDTDVHSLLSNESDEEYQHESFYGDDKNESINSTDNENLSESDDDNDHSLSPNKTDEEYHESDNSNDNNANYNKNKKHKNSKLYELRRLYSENKHKSTNCTDTSDYHDDEDGYSRSQSINESDNSDDKSELLNKRDNENSANENKHINLDERINMIRAYYRSNVTYYKLSSMFNCSRKQIEDTIANRKNLIEEYKKQHPDFDANELETPKKRICNTLSLDERIDVLRAHSRNHYDYHKLATIFECSKRQIEYTLANRMAIIKGYKKEHPDFNENELKTACKTLSRDKRIDVIKAYHRKHYPANKLAWMFNCSTGEIQNILLNRTAIIKEYEKQHSEFVKTQLKVPNNTISKTLSLDERMEVLKAHDNKQYPFYRLALMFNCSRGQIENTIANRETIVKEYKTQHPDYDGNECKIAQQIARNRLSQNERIHVIKMYQDKHYTPYRLACMFNCSTKQIQGILKNRMTIFKKLKKKYSDFKLKVSKTLSLDKCIDVLRVHDLTHCPYYKLASIFNCSMGEIENTLVNRKTIIAEYKTLHPDYDANGLEAPCNTDNEIIKSKNVHKITLEKCKEVLVAYDHDNDYKTLSRLFNLSVAQLKSIIQNRDGIMKKYETSNNYISNNDYQSDVQTESICLNLVNELSSSNDTTVQNVSHTLHAEERNTNINDKGNHRNLNDSTAEDTLVKIKKENKEFPTHQSDVQVESKCLNSVKILSSNVETTVQNVSQTLLAEEINTNSNDINDSTAAKYSLAKIGIENVKFPTQNEKTYDINRKSTNCSNDSSTEKSKEMFQPNLEEYNMNFKLLDYDHSDNVCDDDSTDLSNDKTLRWNKLYLRKYVQVIKAYDKRNSYSIIASRFNCSWVLIYNIIENRHNILKSLGNPFQKKLTLIERVDVIRHYMLKNYSYHVLSQMYHCSLAEIEKCIQDRSCYMGIYKRLYAANKKIKRNFLSMKTQKEIVNAFDRYPNEMLLSRLYGCSLQRIIEIIEHYKILKECHNKNRQTQDFENVIYNRDILLALKPLVAYAHLINNSAAINIISQLEKHLQNFTTKVPQSNYDPQKNFEICSYKDALNSLKPIEDFINLTKNFNATNIYSELGMHLVEHL